MTKAGTLYGIGVGPGDPELLTLKGWRLLNSVDTIAYPKTETGSSLARNICAPFITDDVSELPIDLPMKTDPAPAQAAYDKAAEKIGAILSSGKHVAFLCEGDPFFYGSFMYLSQRLAGTYKTEIVPGVTSLTASAAAMAQPLAARNDVLTIIPAPLPASRMKARIKSADAVAVIKVGKHFAKVHKVLEELGLVNKATLVEAATTDRQIITPLGELDTDSKPYFSTILIYKGSQKW